MAARRAPVVYQERGGEKKFPFAAFLLFDEKILKNNLTIRNLRNNSEPSASPRILDRPKTGMTIAGAQRENKLLLESDAGGAVHAAEVEVADGLQGRVQGL